MTHRRTLDTALVLTPEKEDFIRNGSDVKSSIATGRHEIPQQSPVRSTLVPLTTRLTVQTAEALRRAYLQQKLAGRVPDTQQEIVEAALREWLRHHGSLE